ncbi:MAG: T9SS C-terminal target domain-containing protein, partial [Calditrichaeota bacterium]
VEGSETYTNETWSNAIDGVTVGWDGTVTTKSSSPRAIFAFADGSIKALHKVNLLVDTNVGYDNRWVKRFRIQVSTKTTKDIDFITVYDGFQDKAKWQQHVFPAVNARYVKIIIDYPNSGPTQLGELECEVGTALLGKLAAGGSESTPDEYALYGNYPNPFNPTTLIHFAIPEDQRVTLRIYNSLGQLIKVLHDADMNAGEHAIQWDALNQDGQPVPSGVYMLHLQAKDFTASHRMMLIK